MAPALSRIWQDPDLLGRVYQARRLLFHVFGLDKNAEHGDWTNVVNRVLSGKLTSAERERATPATQDEPLQGQPSRRPSLRVSREFFEDVVELNQLPREFDELDDRLHVDFDKTLKTMARDALASPAPDKDRLRFVVESVHRQLVWRIIQNSRDLCEKSRQGESWLSWLEKLADEDVRRLANPSPVFGDFELLKDVGEAWAALQVLLGLKGNARTITRERIRKARLDLALKLRDGDPTIPLHDEEISALVPWPEPIAKLFTMLQDPELTPDLHHTLHRYVNEEVEGQLDAGHRGAGSDWTDLKEEAVKEFVDMIAWRIIKNAKQWYRDRKVGATSWAPFVFTNLRKDARKAVNYAQGKSATGSRTRPNVYIDSESVGTAADGARTEGDRAEVLEAISLLPPKLRGPFCLKMGLDPDTLEPFKKGRDADTPEPIEEMSFKEIAEKSGLSAREVSQAFHEAMKRLRQLLGESDS